MPRNHKRSSANGHVNATTKKSKDKPTYKIIVLGSGGVGKSAVTIQFVKSFFFSDYDPTIEDSYVKQCLIDNQIAQLEILDSAGQEEFKPMRDQYVRVGEGFLLVFSLTDRRSLDECYKLHRDILRLKDTNNVPMLLIGNKLDICQMGMDAHARAAAASMCIPYFETSARTRHNIDEIFIELVRLIRRNKCQYQTNNNISSSKKKKKQENNTKCCICTILIIEWKQARQRSQRLDNIISEPGTKKTGKKPVKTKRLEEKLIKSEEQTIKIEKVEEKQVIIAPSNEDKLSLLRYAAQLVPTTCMKIGYPCICTANHVFRLAQYTNEKCLEVTEQNFLCLQKISSQTVPFASHPICTVEWANHSSSTLRSIGVNILKIAIFGLTVFTYANIQVYPILFDNRRHACLNNGATMVDAMTKYFATWPKGQRPLIDYATQQTEKRLGAHTKHIDEKHFELITRETRDLKFDIMLEIKVNEQSAIIAVPYAARERVRSEPLGIDPGNYCYIYEYAQHLQNEVNERKRKRAEKKKLVMMMTTKNIANQNQQKSQNIKEMK
ncbi:unnamed protein product [Rotaria magnacalcarata]